MPPRLITVQVPEDEYKSFVQFLSVLERENPESRAASAKVLSLDNAIEIAPLDIGRYCFRPRLMQLTATKGIFGCAIMNSLFLLACSQPIDSGC